MTGGSTTTLLLVDGAMVGGSPSAQALKLAEQGVALYNDLGEPARATGPWLLPYDEWAQLSEQPLPQRLGMSVVSAKVSVDDLLGHLQSLRTVTMDDGQRFYLRLADTRALTAMMRAWPADLLARIKGPIERWQWVGRGMQVTHFAPDVAGVSRPMPRITLAQFEALVQAGEADRLAAELETMNEPGLQPCRDAEQFHHAQQALGWCAARAITTWRLRCAVARLAVLSGGKVLLDAGFDCAAQQAQHTGEFGCIDAWPIARPDEGQATTARRLT